MQSAATPNQRLLGELFDASIPAVALLWVMPLSACVKQRFCLLQATTFLVLVAAVATAGSSALSSYLGCCVEIAPFRYSLGRDFYWCEGFPFRSFE
jgi:hypothetical protein